jgi:ribonuclease HI
LLRQAAPRSKLSPPCASADGTDVIFHDAAGRFRGRTTATNADNLWQRWVTNHPGGTHAKFYQRVIHLFAQYTERTSKSNRRDTTAANHLPKSKHQRSLPGQLIQALHACFSISQEMFSSPFNVHPDTARFWTPFKNDTDFAGASPDAFSLRWSGAALVHPEFEDACLAKAAKHAVSAVHGHDACLFIFVAPHWPNKAFHHSLCQSNKAHVLFSAPAKTLNTVLHQHGPTATANAPYNYAVDVWIVANEAGLETYYDADAFPALHAQIIAACTPTSGTSHLSVAINKPAIYTWLVEEAANPAQRATRPPRRARRRNQAPTADAQPTHHNAPRLPQPTPMRQRTLAFPHAASIIFTDGSQKKNTPNCGCGVFTSNNASINASFQFTGVQTIMRAELSAISYALGRAPTTENITIATDSLSSLQAIRKALNKPHRVRHHRSAKLLQQIVRQLQQRHASGSHTSLIKVRAHTGIAGNEEADKLAKRAVEGDCSVPTINNPAETTYNFDWQTRTSEGRTNVLHDGKQISQAATDARVATVCEKYPQTPAAKWATAATKDGLLHAASNAFRNTQSITFKQKRTLLQLRCHRWIGNGLKNKWRLAPNPRCPHCTSPYGAYDDGLHSAICCKHPQLAGMITLRHDKAVHLIVDAVQKAHHERPFHLFVSAGRRFQESSNTLSNTIPDWALPGNTLKPDLVLVLGWSEDMPIPAQPSTDVEFVICDLTCGYGDKSTQRILRKQEKYAHIVNALRLRGWAAQAAASGTSKPADDPESSQNTDIFVASFGATGEIYESSTHALRALGIDKLSLKSLLTSIHLHIVRSTCQILSTRRKLDSLLQQQQPASTRRGEG